MRKKIGIVGTGDIAKQFIKQIDKEKYEVISVFNHREESLIKFVKEHNISHQTTNYDTFLAIEGLDIVYIATPNQTHYEYVKKALENKKHVLCEKVLTLTHQECKNLFEFAKQNEVILLEAVTLYYMPMFKKVKELINSFEIGKMSSMNVTFGSCKEYDPNNRFFSKEKGGGALFDIGIYALSAVVYFLGTDINLVATDVEFATTGVDEKSATILKNSEGVQASVLISFRGKMPKQIIITGDKGFIKIDDFPRAEIADIMLNSGTSYEVNLGKSNNVFTYELDYLMKYANNEKNEHDLREMTQQVILLMDEIRVNWKN